MCQHVLASLTGSPQPASVATVAAAVAVGGAVATAVLIVVVAGTVAGEAAGGGRETDPAGHETQCGLDDSWPCLFHL